MSYTAPGFAFGAATNGPRVDAPLVLLFERDDAMAVPLLSQLRLTGFDVRAARTPVDLFDTAQKHAVALIVVDLSNAAAGRREFWVALDAQRRGRATQVLTFRVVTASGPLMADLDAPPHALADLEIGGPHEVPLLVEAVYRRVALTGGEAGSVPHSGAVGMVMPEHASSGTLGPASPWRHDSTSPFASPAPGNPFGAADSGSPFDQPDARNPFAQTQPRPQSALSTTPTTGNAWPTHGADRAASFGRLPAVPPISPPATTGFGTSNPRNPTDAPYENGLPAGPIASWCASPSPVSDAWMPPDGAALPLEPHAHPPAASPSHELTREQLMRMERGASASVGVSTGVSTNEGATEQRVANMDYRAASLVTEPSPAPRIRDDQPQAEMSTAPVAAPHPTNRAISGGALIRPEERALGAVLVEGALISPERFEVLADIRRMLTTVDVDINLGELALLFRFLSPDQLLAALLVSRRLITPEQIAALGRIKQEMGASGINYDLETLLVMFNIMTREELDRLRSELA